jgi:hypothetical protein
LVRLVAACKYCRENAVRIFVGNIIDLKLKREVEEEEGRGLAD